MKQVNNLALDHTFTFHKFTLSVLQVLSNLHLTGFTGDMPETLSTPDIWAMATSTFHHSLQNCRWQSLLYRLQSESINLLVEIKSRP